MVGKKLLAALILALCLAGCSRQEPAPQPPILPETTPPPDILTDVGQAETLQDYYGRTAIISRNEWVEGNFIETRTWAEEYAALEYPDHTCEITFAGGFSAPEAMFRDGLQAGATLWELALTAPDGGQFADQVQVLHFGDKIDGVSSRCLSGLLTGEDILHSRPQAYAYLALDTRFAARMQPLPEVIPPENTLTVELDWLEGASFENTWLLDDRHLAVDSRHEGEITLVQVVDLETMEILSSWEKEGYWYQTEETPGVLTLRSSRSNDDGLVAHMAVRINEGRPQLTENAVYEDMWQVGSTVVSCVNGSLVAGDQVLLRGVMDEDEVLDSTSYRIEAVLDDHRFFYCCVGYEWIEGYGIYDLETHTATPMVLDDPFADCLVVGPFVGDKALAFYCPGPAFGFSLLDLNTLTLEPLPVGHKTADEALDGYVVVNEELTRMALVSDEADKDNTITLIDLRDGGELLTWTVPQGALVSRPEVQLVGEDLMLVTMDQWATDTSWVYRLDYSDKVPRLGPLTLLPEGTKVRAVQPQTVWLNAEAPCQVGEHLVEFRQNSLWLGDKLLLEGNMGETDATETVRYLARSALDDHRFLFACAGWEWTNYWGVYDLETDTWQKVWETPDGYLVIPETGETRALAFTWFAEWQWGYHALDLNTGEGRPLLPEYQDEATALQGYCAANRALTRMVLADCSGEDYVLTVRDTGDGSVLLRWVIPKAETGQQPTLRLEGEDTLVVTVKQPKADSCWQYTVTY